MSHPPIGAARLIRSGKDEAQTIFKGTCEGVTLRGDASALGSSSLKNAKDLPGLRPEVPLRLGAPGLSMTVKYARESLTPHLESIAVFKSKT